MRRQVNLKRDWRCFTETVRRARRDRTKFIREERSGLSRWDEGQPRTALTCGLEGRLA
jgi:hypothetical protein